MLHAAHKSVRAHVPDIRIISRTACDAAPAMRSLEKRTPYDSDDTILDEARELSFQLHRCHSSLQHSPRLPTTERCSSVYCDYRSGGITGPRAVATRMIDSYQKASVHALAAKWLPSPQGNWQIDAQAWPPLNLQETVTWDHAGSQAGTMFERVPSPEEHVGCLRTRCCAEGGGGRSCPLRGCEEGGGPHHIS